MSLALGHSSAYPSSLSRSSSSKRQTTDGPYVFAHWMGITRPIDGNYTNDIQLAKAAGIDAFALNYGGWSVDYPTQDGYLQEIYDACEANDFQIFISVDCTSTDTSGNLISAAKATSLYRMYLNHTAQFKINGKALLSSFQVNDPAWNWQVDVLDNLGTNAYTFFPCTLSQTPSMVFNQDIGADGYFSWIHPDSTPDEEASIDAAYATSRNSSGGKKWMAALAPWFFKRFDINNNWSHAQDSKIFVHRAKELLKAKPDMIELTTWNDWGESSYFGPADTSGLCTVCYWTGLDHSGFLAIVKPVIAAFKARQTQVSIADGEEDIFMYYRLQPNTTLGSQDGAMPLPKDAETLQNNVYVVGLLQEDTAVTFDSGGTTHHFTLMAGLSQHSVTWNFGNQSMTYTLGGVRTTKTGPLLIQTQLDQYNGNVIVV
jgi:glucan endo-1,3-alpha-glucosidase